MSNDNITEGYSSAVIFLSVASVNQLTLIDYLINEACYKKYIFLRHHACHYCAVHNCCLNMDWQVCVCDENCGVQSLDRRTETDRNVKTEGPKILSNDIFYLNTDHWRPNKEVSNICGFFFAP